MDKNHDGSVSATEWLAFWDSTITAMGLTMFKMEVQILRARILELTGSDCEQKCATGNQELAIKVFKLCAEGTTIQKSVDDSKVISKSELLNGLPPKTDLNNEHELVWSRGTMGKLFQELNLAKKGELDLDDWLLFWKEFERRQGLGSCALHLGVLWTFNTRRQNHTERGVSATNRLETLIRTVYDTLSAQKPKIDALNRGNSGLTRSITGIDKTDKYMRDR